MTGPSDSPALPQIPDIVDPELGAFTRAITHLEAGPPLVFDWYVGSADVVGSEVECMVRATEPEEVRQLLSRLKVTVAAFPELGRTATDAVVERLGDGEPSADELEDAAADLKLETIEATADGVVLHFTDTCGEHFLGGYWPAVRLGADHRIIDITVEA
ncbi:hypothetical protein ASE14_00940 [Agromyces sp. Root81]|uniref:hypothetical protein n=1 Tax=Agromyces sp. Root81 TaxID=1736601 RepID=UPI0006FC097D|nr:hypothetical protein [Agromyces sp. Root81]KRC62437.1 hypothetical protein ASE14_00940 [Agromyces sp. Root81]